VTQPATGLLPNLAEAVHEALQEICLCLSHVMPPFGTTYLPLLFHHWRQDRPPAGHIVTDQRAIWLPAELPEIKRRTAIDNADPLTRGAGLIEGAA
jgi:hypothetical protein